MGCPAVFIHSVSMQGRDKRTYSLYPAFAFRRKKKGENMKKSVLRIISFTVSLLMIMSLFSCGKKEKTEKIPSYCAKTASITLTVPMFTYFYNEYVRNYVSLNSEFLKQNGFDPEKSPESQKYAENMTWKDYFTAQVKPTVSRMMSMATAAAEENFPLADEDMKGIEKAVEAHRMAAQEEQKTVDEYLTYLYGEGVDLSVFEQCLKLRAMAEAYQKSIKVPDFSDMTDEKCEDFFRENPDGILHYDCIKITVPSEDTEALLKATDAESFTKAMREVVTKNNFGGEYEENTSLIENMLLTKTFVKEQRIRGTKLSDWAFEEGRKPYDICTVTQSTGNITVAMILPADGEPGKYNDVLYRDERPTYTVKTVSYENSEAAAADYETIMDTDVDAAEFFGKTDGVTTLEDISRSDVKGALRDWIFADGRELGDVGCVTGADGKTQIAFIEEIGEASWKSEAKKAAAEDYRKKTIEATINKYPCEFNEDGVKAVKSTVFAAEG